MRKADPVFQLIKSLTKQEKRYFKLFATRHTIGRRNKYLLLFEALEKQKEFNETLLLERLKKEKFVTYFSEAKNYLYEMILKSLEAYHAYSSIDAKLRRSIHDIEILFNKNLPEHCSVIINKAEKTAIENENYYALSELLQWKLKVSRLRTYKGIIKSELRSSHVQQKKTIKSISRTIDYEFISSSFFLQLRTSGMLRNEKEIRKTFAPLIKKLLLKPISKTDSTRSKFLFYNINGLYSSLIGNDKNSYNNYKKLVTYLDEKKYNINEKLTAYYNFTNICIYEKKIDEALENVSKLEGISTKSIIRDIDKQIKIYNLKMLILMKTGDVDSGQQLIPKAEKYLNLHQNKIDKTDELTCYYYIAAIFMCNEKYRPALKWINKIIDDPHSSKTNVEAYIFAFTLLLIIHYELGNEQVMPYLLRSIYRFLYKKHRLSKFENVIFKQLNRFYFATTEKELKQVFKKLKDDLILLTKDNFEKSAFNYFDIISWLESKIENRPMIEIIKEKVKLMLSIQSKTCSVYLSYAKCIGQHRCNFNH